MPFARFMELALYDPDGGYYRSAEARPGRAGDFLTAPELHPIFGATLATGCARRLGAAGPAGPVRRPRARGRRRARWRSAILDGIATTRPAWPRPSATGRSRSTRDGSPRSRRRLATPGSAGDPRPPTRAVHGVVLANEVLDALPVHRVVQRGDELRELAWTSASTGPSSRSRSTRRRPALAARLAAEGVELVDGQTAEICLGGRRLGRAAPPPPRARRRAAHRLRPPAAELYDPVRRRDGTLRAYVRHRSTTIRTARRAAGPDGARRRDRGRAGRRRPPACRPREHDPGRGADGARDPGAAAGGPGRPGDHVGGLLAVRVGAAAHARPGRDGPLPGHGLRPGLAGRARTAPGARPLARLPATARPAALASRSRPAPPH